MRRRTAACRRVAARVPSSAFAGCRQPARGVCSRLRPCRLPSPCDAANSLETVVSGHRSVHPVRWPGLRRGPRPSPGDRRSRHDGSAVICSSIPYMARSWASRCRRQSPPFVDGRDRRLALYSLLTLATALFISRPAIYQLAIQSVRPGGERDPVPSRSSGQRRASIRVLARAARRPPGSPELVMAHGPSRIASSARSTAGARERAARVASLKAGRAVQPDGNARALVGGGESKRHARVLDRALRPRCARIVASAQECLGDLGGVIRRRRERSAIDEAGVAPDGHT